MLITSVDMAQEQMFKQHGIGLLYTQFALVISLAVVVE
jgi:hypothetical protein